MATLSNRGSAGTAAGATVAAGGFGGGSWGVRFSFRHCLFLPCWFVLVGLFVGCGEPGELPPDVAAARGESTKTGKLSGDNLVFYGTIGENRMAAEVSIKDEKIVGYYKYLDFDETFSLVGEVTDSTFHFIASESGKQSWYHYINDRPSERWNQDISIFKGFVYHETLSGYQYIDGNELSVQLDFVQNGSVMGARLRNKIGLE